MIKKLNFSWTQNDINNYSKDLLTLKNDLKSIKKNSLKLFTLKVILLTMVLCLVISMFFIGDFSGNVATLFFTVAIFIILIYIFVASKKSQQIKQNLIINSANNEVVTNTEDGKTIVSFEWTDIQKIFNTENNILLFKAKNHAFIIPKRIFSSEEELNETWNLIQECFNKAKEDKENS